MSKAVITLDGVTKGEDMSEVVNLMIQSSDGSDIGDLSDDVFIELMKEDCGLEDVKVISRTPKNLSCQCVSDPREKLPDKFSFKGKVFLIKLQPDKSKVTLYFKAEVGTLKCAPKAIVN
jgi:hypothetical protein